MELLGDCRVHFFAVTLAVRARVQRNPPCAVRWLYRSGQRDPDHEFELLLALKSVWSWSAFWVPRIPLFSFYSETLSIGKERCAISLENT